MDNAPTEHRDTRNTFRRTLLRVMAMQLAALAILWLAQMRYAG
jgi:hypothetical protein